MGPGERPLLVPEKLALQDALLERSAVDDQERLVAPLRMLVDGLRNEFFAGPALPSDEDGGIGRRDADDHLEDLPNFSTHGHDLGKRLFLSQACLEVDILSEDLLLFVRLLDQEIELGGLAGLRKIGVGAELHGLHGSRDGSVSGENDHFRRQDPLLFYLLENIYPPELGHLEIQDEDIEFLLIELLQGLLPIRGYFGAVSLPGELCLQHLGEVLLVIGD